MKQYHTFFKEAKYHEAESYAMRAHELDPDDASAGAAVYIAQTQKNRRGQPGQSMSEKRCSSTS